MTALAQSKADQKTKDAEGNLKNAKLGNKSLEILQKLRTSNSPKEKELLGPKLSLNKKGGLSRLSTSRLNQPQHKSKQVIQDIPEKQMHEDTNLKPQEEPNYIPEVNFNIVYDDSILSNLPNTPVALFLFNAGQKNENVEHNMFENRNKRRRHNDDLFHPITNNEIDLATTRKIKENFEKPSPDDEILNAQKNAFEANMSHLNISDDAKSRTSTPEPSSERKPPKSTNPFKKIDLSQELSTHKAYLKPHKSFVVIGHVDAGKSTLMGRLLFDLGVVDAKTVNNLVRQSEREGKGSFALAWIMDQTGEERSRGVTVDICATNFETNESRFTAIDAPGHKDFVPQMISGVSQADFSLLVVDSINGEFESGFVMDGQTKEHTILAKNLGIAKLCVVVNKMDKEDWSEKRFDDIKFQMTDFLTGSEIGFSTDQIDFIPISGLTGQNVVKNKTIKNFEWYKGPTLIKYLEDLKVPDQVYTKDVITKLTEEDFNLSINDILDTSNSEFVVSGKVTSGIIQTGETVAISPCNEFLQVQSLSIHDKPIDVGVAGEIVLMSFKTNQLSNKNSDDLNIGDLVLKVNSPIKSVRSFIASIHLFNMKKPLLLGSPFVLFRNNFSVPAKLSKIIEIEGSEKKKKKHLISNQSALVEIEVKGDRLLPVTKFVEDKILGRVVIRREGVTVGAGTISDY